jgi:hypothetical protein
MKQQLNAHVHYFNRVEGRSQNFVILLGRNEFRFILSPR